LTKKRLKSHQNVWEAYNGLRVWDMGLSPLTLLKPWEIIDERNRENYTFDGYMLLDFNSTPEDFADFFMRDVVKALASVIYDEYSGCACFLFISASPLWTTGGGQSSH